MNTTKKAVSKKISVIISLIPLSLGYIEIFVLVKTAGFTHEGYLDLLIMQLQGCKETFLFSVNVLLYAWQYICQ